MVAPISHDLRKRVIYAYEQGDSQDEIADRFLVSQSTVSRLITLFNTQGHLVALKPGGNQPTIHEDDYPLIRDILKQEPDLSLSDIAVKISILLDKPVLSTATICRLMKKLNLNRKKKSRQAAEQDREDVKKKR